MGSNLTTYEVRVEVEKHGSEKYREISWYQGVREKRKPIHIRVADKVVKMFHKDARTPQQAMKQCEKHGRPISCRKANFAKMGGDIEKLQLLPEPYLSGNPYENVIGMDEMIWKKKDRRRQRIENYEKDKPK